VHSSKYLPRSVLLLSLIAALPALAHNKQLSTEDYDRAAAALGQNVFPLVIGGSVNANWLKDGRFTYRSVRPDNTQFLIVDPAHKSSKPLFDHAALAATLSKAANGTYSATSLPFSTINVAADVTSFKFNLNKKTWSCTIDASQCAVSDEKETVASPAERMRRMADVAVTSPDGKRAAFIKNFNLWVRDLATKVETQLTFDGEKTTATQPTMLAGSKVSKRFCYGHLTPKNCDAKARRAQSR